MHPTWIFDLDNTLHNANHAIFPRIDLRMTLYIMQHLGLDEPSARALRQQYYQRFGATLRGMMRYHSVDPVHFLRETHRTEELLPLLVWDHQVSCILHRLPGRKIMLSNGPQNYVEHISDRLGITRHFAALYGVEKVAYKPKPLRQAFQTVLSRERLDPAHCIMVEDSLDNLRTARGLGMKTVWLSSSHRRPHWVDSHITTLSDLRRLALR
ncbi:pyrimidine 5'-nucleotidase [Paludibacterium yongneupense]|uniref:pyrimidine 5'-nucleotidase n=1 Tax=Paludibacterium yongneupense TaxID=400061 RepID=UPI0003FF4532|nr:pyrimidine 5'-nucleotidase [Paludibacterium yongneupense]